MSIVRGERPGGGARSGFELRWYFVLMATAAIAISYFDRQTLPVAISSIQRSIPISDQQFSYLQMAFLLAYAATYVIGGRLLDLLGTRRGFMLIMVWWSAACALHGLASGMMLLLAARFLLGMGEGGAFPAAARVVSEWIAPEDRSTAMGIINAGTAVGSVLALPLVGVVLLTLGWRAVFLLSGGLGIAWVMECLPERGTGGVVEHDGRADAGSGVDVRRDDWAEQCAGNCVRKVHERFGLVFSAVLAAEVFV
jgi:MFS family permease